MIVRPPRPRPEPHFLFLFNYDSCALQNSDVAVNLQQSESHGREEATVQRCITSRRKIATLLVVMSAK